MAIRENWLQFKDDLERTAAAYGRDVRDICVMAVSKTRPVEDVVTAREAGLSIFGENRIDEALDKFEGLDVNEYPLYIIGHVQGNKVPKIGPRVAGVHSVDSLKIARKLSEKRSKTQNQSAPLEVLVQVNTSGEDTKSGFRDREELRDVVAEIVSLPSLEFRGLMTMAPFVDDEKTVRDCFATCREWAEDVSAWINGSPVLSMGMSSDYRWAVAEGSTLLRIGTTIFGRR